MNVTVNLPAEIVERLKKRAADTGQTLEAYLEALLGTKTIDGVSLRDDELLDTEYMTECAKEADPTITIESVHEALAKIPGSMTEDFIAERDER
jgi:hypothetical protein